MSNILFRNSTQVAAGSFKNPTQEFMHAMLHGTPVDSGVAVSQKSAMAFTAIYRAVWAIGAALATVPKPILRKDGKSRETLSDHPAHVLLNVRPNGYMKPFNFDMMLAAHVLLWGNFYALIKRDVFGDPIELLPFPPGTVRPFIHQGALYFRAAQTGQIFAADDIFHVADLATDGIEGLSKIALHRQAVGIGLAAEKFQASFYGKGTHQGGIVTLPADYKLGETPEEEEETIATLRRTFEKTYTGPENYFRLMMLEAGMDFKPLTMPLSDAQFIESRQFQVKEVARMMGVPLSKIMDYERAIQANLEQDSLNFVQESILPWATAIEQEVNLKLVKETERPAVYCRFKLQALVRADMKTRYESYKAALGNGGPGFMAPEEIRELEDINEIDEEKLFMPMNYQRQNAPVQTQSKAS